MTTNSTEPQQKRGAADLAGTAGGGADLVVRGLESGYGRGAVVNGIDLDVPARGAVSILGRNGVGKSTLIHALVGMTPQATGRIDFGGHELIGRPTSAVARAGIGLVPQGRRIFGRLTVEENLAISRRRTAAPVGGRTWDVAEIYDLLPRLAERRRHGGNQLSGGEQQMLSIGRALLGNPTLLLLDEPGDGLAPTVVRQICDLLLELRTSGISLLLVEQNLRTAFSLADTIHVMEKGRFVYSGPTTDFRSDEKRARQLLGVH